MNSVMVKCNTLFIISKDDCGCFFKPCQTSERYASLSTTAIEAIFPHKIIMIQPIKKTSRKNFFSAEKTRFDGCHEMGILHKKPVPLVCIKS